MREILIVLRVPDGDEPGADPFNPQDGDTLTELAITVQRGSGAFQSWHTREAAAILSFDDLIEFVSGVVSKMEEARPNDDT